jgi:hypothetical protein
MCSSLFLEWQKAWGPISKSHGLVANETHYHLNGDHMQGKAGADDMLCTFLKR